MEIETFRTYILETIVLFTRVHFNPATRFDESVGAERAVGWRPTSGRIFAGVDTVHTEKRNPRNRFSREIRVRGEISNVENLERKKS